MNDSRRAGIPKHPGVTIPFPRKIRSILKSSGLLGVLVVACSPPPAANPPAPPQPIPVAGPFQMDPTLTPDLVPGFQQGPLIVWGPEPVGVKHAERARTYDL